MNREIKFRAWFTTAKLMGIVTNLKGSNDGFTFDGVVAECWPNGKQQFYEAYKIFVLMQYTGLKDKNGKEIYEGDVIGMETLAGVIPAWVIEWNAIYGSMRLKQIGKAKSDCTHWSKYFFNNHEVIGNIYENPELIKDTSTQAV